MKDTTKLMDNASVMTISRSKGMIVQAKVMKQENLIWKDVLCALDQLILYLMYFVLSVLKALC